MKERILEHTKDKRSELFNLYPKELINIYLNTNTYIYTYMHFAEMWKSLYLESHSNHISPFWNVRALMLAMGLHYLCSVYLSILHKTLLDIYYGISKALINRNTSSFKLLPFFFTHHSYLPLRDQSYAKRLYVLCWCPRQFKRARVTICLWAPENSLL